MKAYCRDLGLMDYKACWDLQQELFDALVARKRAERDAGGSTVFPAGDSAEEHSATDDDPVGTVLLVEHPPVYTLGKSGHAENLLIPREMLERMGARFYHIDRGGDITFHGPGQLVCYPILDSSGSASGCAPTLPLSKRPSSAPSPARVSRRAASTAPRASGSARESLPAERGRCGRSAQ